MSSLKDFIPSELMSAVILTKLRKSLVAGDVVGTDYNGILANYGDSFKIPTFNTSGASDYTKNQTLTYSALDGAGQVLTINQQKYFSYGIDKIDNQQAIANIQNELLTQATLDLSEAADQYLLSGVMPAQAGITGGSTVRALGTSGSAISVASSGVMDYVGRYAQRLDEENVPQDGRFMIVPPWMHNYLVVASVLETDGSIPAQDQYANGRVGRFWGFDIRVSNNGIRPAAAASCVLAGVKSSTQFVDNLIETGIRDLEQTFGYGVRGLYVYGAKVVRTLGLAVGYATQA